MASTPHASNIYQLLRHSLPLHMSLHSSLILSLFKLSKRSVEIQWRPPNVWLSSYNFSNSTGWLCWLHLESQGSEHIQTIQRILDPTLKGPGYLQAPVVRVVCRICSRMYDSSHGFGAKACTREYHWQSETCCCRNQSKTWGNEQQKRRKELPLQDWKMKMHVQLVEIL